MECNWSPLDTVTCHCFYYHFRVYIVFLFIQGRGWGHSRLIPMYNARFILWPPSLSSPINMGRERRPRWIKKALHIGIKRLWVGRCKHENDNKNSGKLYTRKGRGDVNTKMIIKQWQATLHLDPEEDEIRSKFRFSSILQNKFPLDSS